MSPESLTISHSLSLSSASEAMPHSGLVHTTFRQSPRVTIMYISIVKFSRTRMFDTPGVGHHDKDVVTDWASGSLSRFSWRCIAVHLLYLLKCHFGQKLPRTCFESTVSSLKQRWQPRVLFLFFVFFIPLHNTLLEKGERAAYLHDSHYDRELGATAATLPASKISGRFWLESLYSQSNWDSASVSAAYVQ